MIRRLFRIGLLLGILAGVAIALTKLLGNESQDAPAPAARPSEPWPRLIPEPLVSAPRAVPDPGLPEPVAPGATWVEPSGGVCPSSHPVKAKLASKIFHLPGMANYERTRPDRCYLDTGAAEADGLRAAKR